jgi:hypothetical protein
MQENGVPQGSVLSVLIFRIRMETCHRYLRASLTVTNTNVGGQPAEGREAIALKASFPPLALTISAPSVT